MEGNLYFFFKYLGISSLCSPYLREAEAFGLQN